MARSISNSVVGNAIIALAASIVTVTFENGSAKNENGSATFDFGTDSAYRLGLSSFGGVRGLLQRDELYAEVSEAVV